MPADMARSEQMEGRKNEAELIAAAKELDIAVMGPNCAGFVNYIDNVQAFAFISAKRDRKGSVGVVSQSGQLCLSMMDDPGMRFSYSISAGNGKIVQMEDYMDFLVEDEDTKVVSVYIEGVKNAAKFADVTEKSSCEKETCSHSQSRKKCQRRSNRRLPIQEVSQVPMHPLMQF